MIERPANLNLFVGNSYDLCEVPTSEGTVLSKADTCVRLLFKKITPIVFISIADLTAK